MSLITFGHSIAQSQDTLEVILNRPPNGSQVQGLRQSPSYPNLSIISVLDKDGHHISGLASTTRWLGPTDQAENGVTISQIWQPLREFHGSEGSNGIDPDLYAHFPAPQIREICETCEPTVPTSITLLMDMSSSLRDDHLLLAKQGLINFVNEMKDGDRAGVIQFASTDSLLPTLTMTSNKNAIIDFINSASTKDWTPLYRALKQGIEQIQVETTSRRCIVIYTDGRNALPGNPTTTFTPDSVIVNAQRNNIPVFTIALGKNTNETILKRVALQTGGRFFKTVDGTEFNSIYNQISEIVRNYYVLAYTSPDACAPDSTRILDVTVNTSTGSGHNQLRYSSVGPPREYDLAVELTSQVSTDNLCIGDEITYSLTISNNGPHTAFDVSLENRLSDSLTDVVYSFEPTQSTFGNALWRFDSLSTSQAITITFAAQVGGDVRPDLNEIVNESRVTSPCDTNPDNDVAIDTAYFDPSECLPDLSITLSALTDSLVVQGADSLWFARQGETFPYFITVNNESRFYAVDVQVRSHLPDSLTVSKESDHKTLLWNIDVLEPFSAQTINFDARVASFMPEGINRLVHSVSVEAANEDPSRLANNTAVDTVYNYVEPRVSDLSVQVSVRTDSFSVMHGDTLWFAASNETFPYFIQIFNRSKYAAENVVVMDVLPDSIISGHFSSGDTIRWNFDRFPAFGDTTLTIRATVSKMMPEGTNLLLNTVSIQAENDNPWLLADNSDEIVVYNYVEPRWSDIVVRSTVKTDSFTVQGADTVWLVQAGESYSYSVTVRNDAKYIAENVVITGTFPSLLSLDHPTAENTAEWALGNLAPHSITNFSYTATLSTELGPTVIELRTLVEGRSDNEDPGKLHNNFAENLVFTIPPDEG
ncbi:VWA domain-containing protein, partial [bacterium]|nr:VWA domain-containing protein [bacterium]